jgi:hypothetical protein
MFARMFVVFGLVSLVGCASTSYTSSWRALDAQPLAPLAGKKVVAIVVAKNAATRRAAEDALAGAISAQGAIGVPGYTLISDELVNDEAKARAAIEAAKAEGVVVMRPVAKDQELRANTTTMYAGPSYGPYWGGYYGYGWGAAWAPSVDIRTDTIITVETLVYSLAQNKLVWAGESKTTNPSKVDAFVRELAAGAAKEMKKAGLL